MGTLELSEMISRNLNFDIEMIVIEELHKRGVDARLNVDRLRWLRSRRTNSHELLLDDVTIITFYPARFNHNVDGLVTYSFDYKIHE